MTSPSVTGCWRCGADVTVTSQYCATCGAAQRNSANPGDAAAPAWNALAADPTDQLAAELIAATAGEYEIIRPLGRGGQATVYLATELALGRRVAIKVMAPEVMSLSGMLERFYAEAVTQANLAHANIVAVYAVRRGDRLNFFTMQYVAGRSLQQAVRASIESGRAIPYEVVRGILYQVGSALGYAHRRGVIHRDVKPGNVMLTAAGEAIVTDFGIAKVLTSDSLTMTGAIFGTASYMSPEQCNAERPTGASDQYSLGIVAYELLTGAPPFTGNAFAMMHAHTTQPPPPISLTRPDCPPALEYAVMRMLAKTPAERFPDVGAAIDAMGAGPIAQSLDDAARRSLIDFAVGDLQATSVDDLVRVPVSPAPRSRSGDFRSRTTDPMREPSANTPQSTPPRAVAPQFQDAPIGASALIVAASNETGTSLVDSGSIESNLAHAALLPEHAPPSSTPNAPHSWLQRVGGRVAVATIALGVVVFVALRFSAGATEQTLADDVAAPERASPPAGTKADSEIRSGGIDTAGSVPRAGLEGGTATQVPRADSPRTSVQPSPKAQTPGRAAQQSAGGTPTGPTTQQLQQGNRASTAPGARAGAKNEHQPAVVAPGSAAAAEAAAISGDTKGPNTATVHAQPADPRSPPDATPVLDALVEQCHFALTSANESRLDELFGRGGNDATRDMRSALKARPTVGAISDRRIVPEESSPTAEFSVAINWQNNFGAKIRERYVIRARASLGSGAWQPLGCVVVGRTRLK